MPAPGGPGAPPAGPAAMRATLAARSARRAALREMLFRSAPMAPTIGRARIDARASGSCAPTRRIEPAGRPAPTARRVR